MSRIEITGKDLKTFFDSGDSDWSLAQWVVPNGKRVSGSTTIAILKSSSAAFELESFDEGFLQHLIAEGDLIGPDTRIASIIPPYNLVELEFALEKIHDGEPYDADLVMSAVTLCEHADEINNCHLLRCLDLGGSVAAWGARGLYAKTFRDGFDRFKNSGSFSTDRRGWEKFLRENT